MTALLPARTPSRLLLNKRTPCVRGPERARFDDASPQLSPPPAQQRKRVHSTVFDHFAISLPHLAPSSTFRIRSRTYRPVQQRPTSRPATIIRSVDDLGALQRRSRPLRALPDPTWSLLSPDLPTSLSGKCTPVGETSSSPPRKATLSATARRSRLEDPLCTAQLRPLDAVSQSQVVRNIPK
jgi:hypothetical protein